MICDEGEVAPGNVAVELLAGVYHSEEFAISWPQLALRVAAVSGGVTHDVLLAICVQLLEDGRDAQMAIVGVDGEGAIWVR